MAQFGDSDFDADSSTGSNTREEAERAIEAAMLVLDKKRVTADQLSALADAVDALKERAWSVAVARAAAAMRPAGGVRYAGRLKALAEIRRAFREAKQTQSVSMATPIVNARMEIVGWTYRAPKVVGDVLRHPEAERLVGGAIGTRQVQLVERADIVRAGGPQNWPGPWVCYALCSVEIPPGSKSVSAPVVGSAGARGSQRPPAPFPPPGTRSRR